MTEQKLISSVEQSVRSDVKADNSGAMFMYYLTGAGQIVSPWWSRRRDVQLRALLKKSDHLSGAIYNFATKIAAIPIKIVPRDMSIRTHVKLAAEYTELLKVYSEFGAGWEQLVTKWVVDYHSQDNGAFIEFIADGKKNEPIRGVVYSVAILDSARCTRTSSPVFPVIYTAQDGTLHKMHYSRISAISQSPSPEENMHNVGFCALSSALNAAQNLIDISIYKQERLGSRPTQGILLTGGGLDPDDIERAMAVQKNSDSEQRLSRYSHYTVVGNETYDNPTLEQVDLNSVPTWFNERESTILGMAVIAMAFGMDARELFPAMDVGATKADAIISHIKQRGKGPGHVIKNLTYILNTKFVPPFLEAMFDFQDDSQDRQQAEIANIRSQARERRLKAFVTTVRVEREIMLGAGEIVQAQFEELELQDGRLETGVTVDILFFSEDKDYVKWLSNVTESNYEDKRNDIMSFIIKSRDAERIRKARRAIAAINYRFDPPETEVVEGAAPVDTSYDDEKIGRKLPREPITATDDTQDYQEDQV